MRIRDAIPGEASTLEALQRRSSDIWVQYRAPLAANPDAIQLPESWVDNRWVRVAIDRGPIGFSVVLPADDALYELDGLFVEPAHMRRGVGRRLVDDAVQRAAQSGARRMEVTAGQAQGFYERLGFDVIESTQTRFGPAVRMRRTL